MQSKNVEHIDVKAFVKAWADSWHLEITDPKERIAKFKEEFERLCRGSGGGTMADKTKEKAAKMRAMSDNELVAYVENRVAKSHSEGFNQGISLRQKDVDNLTRAVTDMHDYILDIGSTIKYTYYDDLIGLVNDIYTIIARLKRR